MPIVKLFIRRTSIKIFLGLLLVVAVVFLLSFWILDLRYLIVVISNLMVLITIIFVEDIKNILYRLGVFVELVFKKVLWRSNKKQMIPLTTNTTISEVAEACFKMASKKTGALICFELNASLEDFQKGTATVINASNVSSELLLSIFQKDSPLHDGAVLIKNNRLLAASCLLPNTTSNTIDKSYGTRHRAAIGVTEKLDCVVVLVSEEKASVHLVKEGKVSPSIPNAERLINMLHESLDKA